jgi:PAS domain S-box-containing protein
MANRRYHILIVEDSPEDRATYRRLLARAGGTDYTFTETDSGEEGIALCRAQKPDCVLLDYRLPDADGLDVLSALAEAGPVSVIMLTGQGDEAVAVQAMKRGAQDYLIKGRMTAPELAGAVLNAIERAELLRRVERAHDRFRLAVEASPSAMVLVDRAGRVVLANAQAERSFGYARAELIGQPVEVLVPERFRAQHPLHREVFAAGPRAGRIGAGRDLYARRKDGTEFPIEVELTPLETDEGPMALASVVDVTARKRLEEERRRLERRVQDAQRLESLAVLAGGVAHRFNNLLVGMLGNASLARDLVPPDSPARAALEGIETSAQQAAELCGQMLFFSGRGRFVVGPLDLSAAVAQMQPLLELTAGSGAALHYELAGGLPPVEADAAQIRQLVLNLVTNAVEALPGPGGRITVTTGARPCGPKDWAETYRGADLPEGLYVLLEVRDNGRGMDAETMGRIFDPFFTTKFTGRGLGLAAVLGIVRGHRGAIQVVSAPGQGATFRVFLPAFEAAAPADVPTAGSGAGKVLVVDDDAMVRGVTVSALRSAGLDVLSAGGGREAVAVMQAQGAEIGLVLLDLVMPGTGGDETLRELRRLRPGLRVLLVSGCTEKEATTRFAGQGLAGFVQKPWRVPDLVGRVRRLLGVTAGAG